MGIGLSISRTIVEAHGGKIWAENGDTGGAIFRFTLPMAEKPAKEREPRRLRLDLNSAPPRPHLEVAKED
jgi:hypothetical protein